ncbi:DsbA family protein [Novosphingobium sp. TH158]|uniref:DsbA family protein n=1 Tax=Novosphingobium sp. TH158 TaxID=2067455 RepID=UPI000C7BA2EB|nr:DsbA family protein [Novosphingobium sp. TH158]PLK27025.1 disulfide bond formation protein DsbA [Novosphingobium sp. TH158]
MTQADTTPRRRPTWAIALACIVLGLALGWGWQQWRSSVDPAAGLSGTDRAAIEKVVHDYLIANPEVLPKAMEALQKKENASALSGIRGDVEKAWPGQVLGNPNGKVTLVEFTDFGCTYCRQSVADVEELVRSNPDLKVVIRQLPILSPESADAAKMGMAAAEQGKYAAFHHAMFAAGKPDARTIQAAAQAAGLDMARAQKVLADPRVEAELARNIELARQLGFNGTPSWVVGNALLSGAVGRERLEAAIKDAS